MDHAQRLELLHLLQRSYRLKFDGTVLWAAPLTKRSGQFSVTVSLDQVIQSEGCTRTALMIRLAEVVGLRKTAEVDERAALIDQVEGVLSRVGLEADYIGPEHYQERSLIVYRPGKRVELRYALIGHDGLTLLHILTSEGPVAENQSLALHHFLENHTVKFKDQKLQRYLKHLDSLSHEARLIRRLNPGLPTELGLPVINRVLVVS